MTPAQTAKQYAKDVLAGIIPACKWIKLAAQRFLNGLEQTDSRWHFDEQRVNKFVAWAQTHVHEKGVKAGDPFIFEPWQVFIVANIFGFVDDEGTRQCREALLLVPRGQGKSPFGALILLWMTFFDGEKKAEGLTAATTEQQAREVFGPAQHFVNSHPAYKGIGVEAAAKSIFSQRTGAKIRPVIGRAKYGSAPYCCVMDEAHQLPDGLQYDNFRTGLAKRRNSLLLTVTTAGVQAIENPAYQLQIDCQKILEGVIENDRIFAAIFTCDAEIDWTSLEALQQACPNLGISVDLENVLTLQKEAIRSPAQQNGFRAMYLNQWTSASAAWMNMVAWGKCHDATLTQETVKNLPGWMGCDLASKLDLSAVIRLHRQDIDGKPHYYCFTKAYLPETRVNLPENQHYQRWAKEGHLTATPGSSMDYATIELDALEDCKTNQIQSFCYDARYADEASLRISEASGIPRVETPPSPAVLSPAMKELEAAVYDGRFHHDNHPVLRWCMSNVLTRETAAGNYTMPDKQSPDKKIDCAVALFIAMARAMTAPIATTDSVGFFFA